MKTPLKIDELLAWISVDQDGNEGIIGAKLIGDTFMPFVGADMPRIESLRGKAREISLHTGYPVRLVRFSKREVLE